MPNPSTLEAEANCLGILNSSSRLVFWPSRCAFGCSQVEPLRVSFCEHGCLYDQMRVEFGPRELRGACPICNNPACANPGEKH